MCSCDVHLQGVRGAPGPPQHAANVAYLHSRAAVPKPQGKLTYSAFEEAAVTVGLRADQAKRFFNRWVVWRARTVHVHDPVAARAACPAQLAPSPAAHAAAPPLQAGKRQWRCHHGGLGQLGARAAGPALHAPVRSGHAGHGRPNDGHTRGARSSCWRTLQHCPLLLCTPAVTHTSPAAPSLPF